ncbi:MAG: hypothetical protein J6U00_10325 [Ruminococcus sp.]|uniref:hypothetical protein n=1 Tax=Ruminococcus sp. TaxID=41978 RepID=UPI001B12ECFC|nr:hypothetical protein [Ruminococcus sp.]MBO7474371.1 hypothetical protein [Ruminococcus sp.]
MSANELKQAIITENEIAFSHNGIDYLLYGWHQCDGYVLSLECNGELVWQSALYSKKACIDEFLNYYSEL